MSHVPTKSEPLLRSLGVRLEAANGACIGPWLPTSGESLDSIDPATGEWLATVGGCTPAEARAVVDRASARFLEWQLRPAPKRGELVRRLGELLRAHKEALGELVSLEIGKIRAEGLGEVQEMIDICDFAVGLSRQLYGLTIASERPPAPHVRAVAPARAGRRSSRVQLPGGRLGLERRARRGLRRHHRVEALAADAALRALAVQRICNRRAAERRRRRRLPAVRRRAAPRSASASSTTARLPLVSFTGSIAVGRKVAVRVAAAPRPEPPRARRQQRHHRARRRRPRPRGARRRPSARSAPPASAAPRTRRVFVQRGIAGRVARAASSPPIARCAIGDPLGDRHLDGPARSTGGAVRPLPHRARRPPATQGGEILCGGQRARPARATSSSRRSSGASASAFPIAWEETFAPILYVFEVDDLEEAIALQNAVPQGLS